MKPAVCALVSGGLDSCVLLAELAREHRRVWPVFVAQGLSWEQAEWRALCRFWRASRLPRVAPPVRLTMPVQDLYGRHWSVTGRGVPGAATPDAAMYLPGRNLLLLTAAAVWCERHQIGLIALGSLRHNPFADATTTFFQQFARVASRALHHRLQIIAPFRHLSKTAVVQRGRHLPLHLSFSCVAPRGNRPCGRCNKCAELRAALRSSGR